jgi:glycosyltransferase involved in cell wall biosynthesis
MRQQHVTTLCNFLQETANWHVTLLNPVDPGASTARPKALDPRVRLEQFAVSHHGLDLSLALKVNNRLRAADPHLLYIIDSWSLPIAWLATMGRMRYRRKGLVYHTFDMLLPDVHRHFHRWLEKRVLRTADLAVNTDPIRARVQRMLYRLDVTPLYIRNCVSRKFPPPRKDAATRARLMRNPAPENLLMVYPTVASSQRLTKEVISAFALLPHRYNLFTYAVENEYGTECRGLVRKLGLQDRVVFSGPVDFDTVVEVCANCDFSGIFHDPEASLGNYLTNSGRLAYLVALGVPVVAGGYPSVQMDVLRYGLGVCCGKESPAEIAWAARRLCERSPTLEERRATVLRAFSEELHYEKMGALLVDRLRGVFSRACAE